MGIYPLAMGNGSLRVIAQTDEDRCAFLKDGYRVLPDDQQAAALAEEAAYTVEATPPDLPSELTDIQESVDPVTEAGPVVEAPVAPKKRGRPKKVQP